VSNDPQSPSSSPARTDSPPDTEAAEVLDEDEIADYEQLRTLVSPAKSLELLDDFAKWLFVTAAIVGTLGASFGVARDDDLTGTGKRMFSWAVALVGISLALAAMARLPLPRRVNRYSDVSLREHVAFVLKVRGVLLFLAALLFASALVLAGLAPLFS
jgi:hypothetical protein